MAIESVPPMPDDATMVAYLNNIFTEEKEKFLVIFNEFQEVVQMTRDKGEPIEFAYARLRNHLAELPAPQILEALAVVIWSNSK